MKLILLIFTCVSFVSVMSAADSQDVVVSPASRSIVYSPDKKSVSLSRTYFLTFKTPESMKFSDFDATQKILEQKCEARTHFIFDDFSSGSLRSRSTNSELGASLDGYPDPASTSVMCTVLGIAEMTR